ncbi:MAG: PHP domain-containing protein [Candidatus Lokiarchaeota archaeon]|nr:PHP domain-containing protein [Candidatus Lokiarchaeota archaeon]
MNPEKSDLHIHSDMSDGRMSVEEIISHASQLRLDTIAITDHFGPCYGCIKANPSTIERRGQFIRDVALQYPRVRVLDGAELDINTDGSMVEVAEDVTPFELVIGSIHQMTNSSLWVSLLGKVTKKYHFDILGHWDGYLTTYRESDGEMAAEILADAGIVVELSSRYPPKDYHFLIAARDAGCKFSLGSDAHWISAIGQLESQLQLAEALELPLAEF